MREISLLEFLGLFIIASLLSIIMLAWSLTEINKAPCPVQDNSVCAKWRDAMETIRIPASIHISFATLLLVLSVILLVALWRKKRTEDVLKPWTQVTEENSPFSDDE